MPTIHGVLAMETWQYAVIGVFAVLIVVLVVVRNAQKNKPGGKKP